MSEELECKVFDFETPEENLSASAYFVDELTKQIGDIPANSEYACKVIDGKFVLFFLWDFGDPVASDYANSLRTYFNEKMS